MIVYAKILIACSMVGIMAMVACKPEPCEWKSDLVPVETIQAGEVVLGTYRPDDFTRQKFPAYFGKGAEIILDASGLSVIKNIPGNIFSFHRLPAGQVINVNGKWHFDEFKLSAGKLVRLVLTANHKLDEKTDNFFDMYYPLYQKNGKYVILMSLDDPDPAKCVPSVRFIQQ